MPARPAGCCGCSAAPSNAHMQRKRQSNARRSECMKSNRSATLRSSSSDQRRSSTHPGDIFVFVHFCHGPKRPEPVNAQRRSQCTLSNSGPSPTHPPHVDIFICCLHRQIGTSLERHPRTSMIPSRWRRRSEAETHPESLPPPHLSPPLSCRTPLSSSQKTAWLCKQTSGRCPSPAMPEAGASHRPILPSTSGRGDDEDVEIMAV